MPVASKNAFARAAAIGAVGGSPDPVASTPSAATVPVSTDGMSVRCTSENVICGESLNQADPEAHRHESAPDPRWSKLDELR